MESLTGIEVKVFATEASGIEAGELVLVLQRWIREHTIEGVLMDVADYAHIPEGPGVILVGHEGNTSFDLGEGRPGLVYRYKHMAEQDNAGRTEAALRYALNAAEILQNESEFRGRLKFDLSGAEVVSNDRLNGPNTDEGFSAFNDVVTQAATNVISGASTTRKENDSRERLTVLVSS